MKQSKALRTKPGHISLNKEKKAWMFLFPSIVGTGIFTAIPFFDVVRRSFTEAFSGEFVGIENYRNVLKNEAFLLAMKNTARFLGICIPLLVVGSLILALAIGEMGKSKKAFQAATLIPMAIPIASVVLFWRLVFDKNGFLNEIVKMMAKTPVDWMNEKTAFYVLVFSYLWKNTGYFIVLWMAGKSSIPKSYYEAAKVDGAGRWACFRYVTLPGLAPSFTIVLVLAFVNSFKVFREAYLIAGDYPHKSIYMLQHLFNNWFVSLDIQKMSTAAVLLAGGISLVITGILKLEKRIGSEE